MKAMVNIMNAAERKKKQRQRDKLLGWQEVTVRVAATQAQFVRDYAATLPDPTPPVDPRQLDMIEQLDSDLSQSKASRSDPQTGPALF